MKKLSKKYVEVSKNVDKNTNYTLEEAIKLVKSTSITKFDATIDFVLKLNVDPKKSDQQLRGSLVLPNGTGKSKRILFIGKGLDAEEAKKAGADFIGDTDMIEKIQKENWFDFDIIVATPNMMPELGKIGKLLGPKGLMPNPKTNTVTTTPAKVIEDIKKGMVEFRTDSYGNIHGVIGKSSFTEKKLEENLIYVVDSIAKLKPSSVKGKFIQKIFISATMGPGIKLDKNSFDI